MRRFLLIGLLALGACDDGGSGGGGTTDADAGSDNSGGQDNGETCALAVTGTLPLEGSPATVVVKDGFALAVTVSGGSGELVSVNLSSPASPTSEASIDLTGFDINPSILADDQFLVLDRFGDITRVDVSDPMQPAQIDRFDSGFPDYRVGVANDHLFVSRNVITVFGLDDSTEPAALATLDTGPNPRQVVGNDTHLFAVVDGEDGNSLIRALDVSDPLNPSEVGALQLPEFGNLPSTTVMNSGAIAGGACID